MIATPTYPSPIVAAAMPGSGSPAPKPFDGRWLHSMPPEIIASIRNDGWNPLENLGSIYGCAVYLARARWALDTQKDRQTLSCWLNLTAGDTKTGFGMKNSQDDLIASLQPPEITLKGVTRAVGKTPARGDKQQNIAIRDYFLGKDIRAIHFIEHDIEVVAVFDPTCIRVIP